MLYPRESESRQINELNGMWDFRADMSPSRNMGFDKQWFAGRLRQSGPVIPMPVPSSFNDITQDKQLRDFVGWVWYDREFFVSSDWMNKRVVLRIDSAHYNTIVWINSKQVMSHVGGHLPFEAQVNSYVNFKGPNLITVAVNNTLTPTTLPPGTIKYQNDPNRYPPGYFVQNLQFDFFNYAGIHRSVRVYATPNNYVDDITITTTVSGANGMVNYTVVPAAASGATVAVVIEDANGQQVASGSGVSGKLTVSNAKLWWPYTMSSTPAYLYTFKVTLTSGSDTDIYRLPFGIRTVSVTSKQLLINGKPFYCHGVAKHEDSDIRGKGLDFALIAKDFNMLKWLGANCFRTSHYPYAEEILDQADRQGVAIIDESPGVGITQDDNFSNASLAHHLEVMEELVRRDKNRPAVIIWSVANEPASNKPIAGPYFKAVIGHTRDLDPSRPVVYVNNKGYETEYAAQYVDIVCVNQYYGWYSDTGHTEVIGLQLRHNLRSWYQKFGKPMIVTEYGADTIPGLHRDPSFVFTEEYQRDFMGEYHKVFDQLRGDFLVGEMVWNFADFLTDQGITRVVGNKKGVLTRQRQPKAAAFLLRERYYYLMNQTLPGSHYGYQYGGPKCQAPSVIIN
ncbi:beta-glucuronidase-like isoform X2 [Liolophura sinensis]|uniref:beta-glucuronidase-like isoform X2 n=1 Tax=Liolophura sinensis TaxID=3198878 RepID=UPI0031589A7C